MQELFNSDLLWLDPRHETVTVGTLKTGGAKLQLQQQFEYRNKRRFYKAITSISQVSFVLVPYVIKDQHQHL